MNPVEVRKSILRNVLEANNNPEKDETKLSKAAGNGYVRLTNIMDDNISMSDTLHCKASHKTLCGEKCHGSIISIPKPKTRTLKEIKDEATTFFELYCNSEKLNKNERQKRIDEVMHSISTTGTYDLTYDELVFGAKTAWRNASRCIGRIQWSTLQVFDCRKVSTAKGMYEAACQHVKFATNGGNIRSAITVFPQQSKTGCGARVWNSQFFKYAGYEKPDGTIIGDPLSVEFTKFCQSLGWESKGGRFDILPWVLSGEDEEPQLFEIPEDLILEVNIKHSSYPWFEEMGLKWYAVPAVADMLFDCGGLEFTAAPFSGWYMSTEIAARSFCDSGRYNILKDVAERMKLDTSTVTSLWKDKAVIEVNVAVLHSFQKAGVTITDHHSASESFMTHIKNEQRLRHGCPADWVWIVPPISGSLTPVFHQEMVNYRLSPSYEYQEAKWKTYRPKGSNHKKITFKTAARAAWFAAIFSVRLLAKMTKCTILFATETGKSEQYAKQLATKMKHFFNVNVVCMSDYKSHALNKEKLVLFLTSTFGSGDPPNNGKEFLNGLLKMSTMKTSTPLKGLQFSIMGLGSTAYPHFCGFAHSIKTLMATNGATELCPLAEGDELSGEEETFKAWTQGVIQASCKEFCIADNNKMKEKLQASLLEDNTEWDVDRFRVVAAPWAFSKGQGHDACKGLSMAHKRNVLPCKLKMKKNLQAPYSDRKTILVSLDTGGTKDLLYLPGDHVAIFPCNNPKLVSEILQLQTDNTDTWRQSIRVQFKDASTKEWKPLKRLPDCTLYEAFHRYLDISTTPSQKLLKHLTAFAGDAHAKNQLHALANKKEAYNKWKATLNPNLIDTLKLFPSVKVPASLLLSQLPLLKHRYYSISSSPELLANKIHITVAVLEYVAGGRKQFGVCSNWLNNLTFGDVIPCFIQPAPAFHMPVKKTTPIIMIGPGTGIAPFRSFWQQRQYEMSRQLSDNKKVNRLYGEAYVYFGCRTSLDNIYCLETKEVEKKGILTRVYTAFSREDNHAKMYVQSLLLKNEKEVFDLIENKEAQVYVCGNVEMAEDVQKVLENIIASGHRKNANLETSGKSFMRKLEEEGRYHKDIFGINLHSPKNRNSEHK